MISEFEIADIFQNGIFVAWKYCLLKNWYAAMRLRMNGGRGHAFILWKTLGPDVSS